MAEKKPTKKMEPHECCKNGHHTYIVTHWDTGGGKKSAVHMKCQHCLLPIDLIEIRNAKWA